MKPLTPDQSRAILVAAVAAHEANRALCAAIGDHSQVKWEDAPLWQRMSALAGVETLFEKRDSTPDQLHESWCAFKTADGWVYGAEKDSQKRTHPCLVPYTELPEVQRLKDRTFRDVSLAIFDTLKV